jgi:predicted metal-dependent hydrolase
MLEDGRNMPDESAANESRENPHPSAPSITIRRPLIDLAPVDPTPEIPRYWWGGDPFKTHFLDALSSTFPFGEAFFVRSVRYYADRIEDPALREEIRLFAGQEGQHSRLHDEHVKVLVAHGYSGLATRNRIVDRILRWHNRRAPAFSLTSTAGIEHLTAILARQVLHDREGWLEDMNPEMKRLWRWHALEEAEHKSVAFDVLIEVAPSRLRRNLAMAILTAGLAIEVLDRMIYMFWKDGQLANGAIWMRGWRFLMGRGGFLRGVGSEYRAWYRGDFHPDEIDDREMISLNAPDFETSAGAFKMAAGASNMAAGALDMTAGASGGDELN